MHTSVWLLLLLFTIAKTWKQSKCPSTDEWMEKVWWIYTWWNTSQPVQSLSYVWLFATPWITARQASLSITNSRSLLKLLYIESVMSSNHLILCCPFLLLPPIPPSIRVFSNESTLCMRQKGGNFAIFNNMDGVGKYYDKWNVRERQILYDTTYVASKKYSKVVNITKK